MNNLHSKIQKPEDKKLLPYFIESDKNLHLLAKELAVNYYNASIIKKDIEYQPYDLRNKILDKGALSANHGGGELRPFIANKRYEVNHIGERLKDIDEIGNPQSGTRNILVLGAGATFDSFTSIPLAENAIKYIHSQIKFAVGGENPGTIDFQQLIDITGENEKQDDKRMTDEDDELINQLTKSILTEDENSSLKAIGEKYHMAKDRLMLYGPEGLSHSRTPDFETSLHLLSEFIGPEKVREAVSELYNKRYGPVYLYELLSHMLKHRVIDVIINFNFDEFLDRSLKDELGKDNYFSILSDGDCEPLEEFLEQNRHLKIPIYIKPHGTVSHKSSMRFTKDHYYELPYAIGNVIRKLLTSEREDGSLPEDRDRINLISVGFNMESIEFNDMINRHLPQGSNIFFFNHRIDLLEIENERNKLVSKFSRIFTMEEQTEEPEKYLKGKARRPEPHNKPAIYLIHHNVLMGAQTQTSAFGFIWEEIWNRLTAYYKDDFKPASIARHQIIRRLFGNKAAWDEFLQKETEGLEKINNQTSAIDKESIGSATENTIKTKEEKNSKENWPSSVYPETYFDSTDYFLDRTLVEIFLSIASGKGIIDPRELLTGKTGEYYNLYFQRKNADLRKKHGDKLTNDIRRKSIVALKDLLDDFGDGGTVLKSHNQMGPRRYRHLEDFANWFGPNYHNPFHTIEKIPQDKTKEEKGVTGWFSKPFRDFLQVLDEEIKKEKKQGAEIFKRYFRQVFESNKSVIKANFYDFAHHMFQNYQFKDILHTKLTLEYWLMRSIEDQQNKEKTIFLAVAEKGFNFLKFKKEIMNKCTFACIIMAYPGLEDDTKIEEQGYQDEYTQENNPQTIEEIEREEKKKEKEREKKILNFRGRMSFEKEEDNLLLLFLPPRKHNHHMMTFLNTEGTIIYGRGIYYLQRGYSRQINPILIEHPENMNLLYVQFLRYMNDAAFFAGKQKPELFDEIKGHLMGKRKAINTKQARAQKTRKRKLKFQDGSHSH